MEFETEDPAIEKNRFPFKSQSRYTDVLYQPITHTHSFQKKSKNPLKQRGI